MAGTEIIGWLVIGTAIAAVIARQRGPSPALKARDVSPAGDAESAADATAPATDARAGDAAWCRATAALCGGSILLFDEGLRLVASGGSLAKLSAVSPALHLIDLASPEETALLLGGAAAARRGEVASWRMAWEGEEARATAVALDAGRLLLCILGDER